MNQAVFRFAPSPNGRLHLGHAYSALLNQRLAREAGGKFLLRIEDTDLQRCTPVLEQRMLDDLNWLGIDWDEPPLRQSDNLENYSKFIEILEDSNLVYPAFMSRREVNEIVMVEESKGSLWPRDPDGAVLYPDKDKNLDSAERQQRIDSSEPFAMRLNMVEAVKHVGKDIYWQEDGPFSDEFGFNNNVKADPSIWGDVILSRKDTPASYHLASVVDDAMQGVTHVVRGRDLFWSTSVHRLLQELLGFSIPRYFHHELILDDDDQKLSKSRNDTSIAEIRAAGATKADIMKMVGLN